MRLKLLDPGVSRVNEWQSQLCLFKVNAVEIFTVFEWKRVGFDAGG